MMGYEFFWGVKCGVSLCDCYGNFFIVCGLCCFFVFDDDLFLMGCVDVEMFLGEFGGVFL